MHIGIQKLSPPQPVGGADGGASALWRRKWRFRQKRLNYTLVGNPAAGISLIAQCGASRGSLILGILQKLVMAMV